MFSIISKIKLFNLPIEEQFDLFDKVVILVLLCGCDTWGYKNIGIIDYGY